MPHFKSWRKFLSVINKNSKSVSKQNSSNNNGKPFFYFHYRNEFVYILPFSQIPSHFEKHWFKQLANEQLMNGVGITAAAK